MKLPSMTPRSRLTLALLWLVVLALAGWWLGSRVELSGDLRKFMPAAETRAQKLLIDELGEGPGSRLLLVALSGSDAQTLAMQSSALRERLLPQPQFKLVANGGDSGLEAIPEGLRPYRYLLSASACRISARPRPHWSSRCCRAIPLWKHSSSRKPGSPRTRPSACTGSGSTGPGAKRCWRSKRAPPVSTPRASRPRSMRSAPPSRR
jgi:hypothetical protein